MFPSANALILQESFKKSLNIRSNVKGSVVTQSDITAEESTVNGEGGPWSDLCDICAPEMLLASSSQTTFVYNVFPFHFLLLVDRLK